ncbi:DUF493 family protein [Carboxylicivirga sp. N1Y90]|uniref:DUF493 family protein n=1 Tax=Carboxylicivirga fragile TaxID=3417571 RepID=UPI003D355E9E|nr:DUF493 family protein [Marinilabiliaceae bacterium N1Y90]
MSMQDYDKLKELLLQNKKWPMLYLFKFIVPNSDGKVEKVVSLLPKHGKVSYRHTKNLKHVSVSCKVSMKNADAIIDISQKVAEIPGVISL